MDRVRIGLAGCGSVSQRGLLPHLAQDDIREWCELAAVMDPEPGRAEASAEKFGAGAHFTDYADMLASDIDAVVIASPIGLHYAQAMQAIESGKHLHLNKTMTTTKAEADDVIAAAASAGLTVVASPGRGHRAGTRRIRDIIEAGDIGRVYFAEIGTAGSGHEHEGFRRGDDILSNVNPAWYYRKPGGGPMYDMAVYALHTITGILGPVQRVTGMSGIGLKERTFKDQVLPVDMDDNTHLLLDFGDSVFCILFGTNSQSGPRGFSSPYISGSDGAIAYEGDDLVTWGRNVPDGRRAERPAEKMPFVFGEHAKIPESHVYSDIMHMVDCALHGKQPAVSAEHARHVIEIIELGYAAAETGQTQAMTTDFELLELEAPDLGAGE
jgi:predicted dehydrogenase